MSIQRLPIVRIDDEIRARERGVLYLVVNPEDVPDKVLDGIFTVDYKHRTAKFESRPAEPPYVTVPWKDSKPTTRSETTTLPDGTIVHRLCSGHVILTIKPGEGGNSVGYAEGDDIPREVLRYVLIQALAGVDVSTLEYTGALEEIILECERKKRG